MSKKIKHIKSCLKSYGRIQTMSNNFRELVEPIMGEYFKHGRVDTKHKTVPDKATGGLTVTMKPVWKSNGGEGVEVYLDDGDIIVGRLTTMGLPSRVEVFGLGDPEMVEKVRASVGRWIGI